MTALRDEGKVRLLGMTGTVPDLPDPPDLPDLPDLPATIVGTANPAHLAANVAIAEKGPLPPETYGAARARLGAPGLP